MHSPVINGNAVRASGSWRSARLDSPAPSHDFRCAPSPLSSSSRTKNPSSAVSRPIEKRAAQTYAELRRALLCFVLRVSVSRAASVCVYAEREFAIYLPTLTSTRLVYEYIYIYIRQQYIHTSCAAHSHTSYESAENIRSYIHTQ